MRCPKCGHQDDKVLDSRSAKDGRAIRRRRECLQCGNRFTTYEEILRSELTVIKSDGSREDFSRQKLLGGIARACQKRPITTEQIDAAVDSIIDRIQSGDSSDIRSAAIGELVMEALRKLDEVAYVRFASVYRRFTDVGQFRSAADEISGEKE